MYNISIPHFYCLEYYEKDRKMVLDIDFRDSIIYLESTLVKNWEAPFNNEPITEKEKKRIIRNIYDYLITQGYDKREVKLCKQYLKRAVALSFYPNATVPSFYRRKPSQEQQAQ